MAGQPRAQPCIYKRPARDWFTVGRKPLKNDSLNMFLVVVENLPHGFRFYEENRRSFRNLISHFYLSNSHTEILVFSEYDSALDIVTTFDKSCLWNSYRDRLHRISVKNVSLCLRQQTEL